MSAVVRGPVLFGIQSDMCLSIGAAVMTRVPVLWVFFAVGVVGCGGVEDDREAIWGYISPAIVQPNCATSSCHSRGAAVAGLNLSTTDDGYKSLLMLHLPPRPGAMPTDTPPVRGLVTPGNPDESRVVNMLRGDGARRMPPDRPLAEADIRLIERWILDGALKD
jgi:hypothetical protein